MDEGKPTKAKWWNRPRPQAGETPDGDFELASPSPPAQADGDYELSRPAQPGQPPAQAEPLVKASGDASADQPGSYAGAPADQPEALAGVPGDRAEAFAGVSEGQAEASAGASAQQSAALAGVPGDRAEAFAGVSEGQAEASGDVSADQPGALAGASAHRVEALAGDPVPEAGTLAGVPVARSADVSETVPVGEPAAAAPEAQDPADDVRPEPLHDPDAYSTPPYGEPGPWASAPPVQHPAATHAQDVPPAASAPPPAPDAPAQAPVPEADASPEAGDPWYRYDPWAARGVASAPAGPLQQTGAAVLSQDQRRSRARKALVGGALGIALLSGLLGGFVGVQLERNGGLDAVKLPQASAAPAGRDADSIAGIAARALPSVVTLHVSGSAESGTGTGFVLDSRGHILTNEHVVAPAGSDGEISVVFNGGQTARAEIVGKDSGYDLAVVKVSGVRGLTPLPLGNSDNVRVGDPVVAIGAPFDLEGTVTSGIISARERPITAGGESGDGSDVSYVDALQTDAPINPGNSGGPLLDARGQVVGINSAIRSAVDGSDADGGQAGSIGLGFAIPVNQGRRVAEELINTGRATHPVIGVTLDMDYTGDGARVRAEGGDGGLPVTPDGPGDRAGIRAGDVITAIDGRRVHSGEELIVKTRAHRPGDRMELTVRRGGGDRTLTLVLGSSGSSD
ncbi:trypsin-like peptidase domain-containing protein [Streptomyces sp. NPDC101166]|uniref:trypsin-like peptidase domain-containing protein n=1 Tax=Streptomyces sp. NPDC101166 TaxID=3366120 RepID=UPI00380D99E9